MLGLPHNAQHAGRECGLCDAMGFDQGGIFPGNRPGRTALCELQEKGRARHLATPLLGTPDPGRGGFTAPCGLHPLESRQAWLVSKSRRLTALELPCLRAA